MQIRIFPNWKISIKSYFVFADIFTFDRILCPTFPLNGSLNYSSCLPSPASPFNIILQYSIDIWFFWNIMYSKQITSTLKSLVLLSRDIEATASFYTDAVGLRVSHQSKQLVELKDNSDFRLILKAIDRFIYIHLTYFLRSSSKFNSSKSCNLTWYLLISLHSKYFEKRSL